MSAGYLNKIVGTLVYLEFNIIILKYILLNNLSIISTQVHFEEFFKMQIVIIKFLLMTFFNYYIHHNILSLQILIIQIHPFTFKSLF